jgi:hypothetical protein
MGVKRGGNTFNPELLNTDITEVISAILHSILSQKTVIFIVTDVQDSNIM